MLKKTLILTGIIFLFLPLFWISEANSEDVTITTYYPAPYGAYTKLTIEDSLSIGSATDYSKFEVGDDGNLTVTTVDSDGTAGHIALMPDGYVGIGTASPSGIFQVSHDGSTPNLVVNSTSGYVSIGMFNPSGIFQVSHDGGSTPDLVVNSTSGYVGIGTTNPNGVLGVNGEINFVPQASDPTGNEGDLYYNSTASEFKYYDGSVWQTLGSAEAAGGGSPESWTCRYVSNNGWWKKAVYCPSGYKLITGGCNINYSNPVSAPYKLADLTNNHPYYNTYTSQIGWYCGTGLDKVYISTYAYCCK